MKEQDFNGVEIFTGEAGQVAQSKPAPTGVMEVEQSRAVAEVQAAMLIAKTNPRDEFRSYEKIMKACKRKSLAESACYAYPRGGKLVTGPTIRLAEVLATHWENMTYGIRELSRRKGSSDVEAFAWDLESNTRVIRTFVVNHIRDKRGGNTALTGERDIYELVANMGQRRVRACILELIPGDIVEAAEKACEETLKRGEKPLEKRVKDMVVAFNGLGVTVALLEGRLGHSLNAITPTQFVEFTRIYKSIKDGVGKVHDFFTPGTTPAEDKEEESFVCPVPDCGFVAKSERGLKKHMTQAHPVEKSTENEQENQDLDLKPDAISIALGTARAEKEQLQNEPKPNPGQVADLCSYLDSCSDKKGGWEQIKSDALGKLCRADQKEIEEYYLKVEDVPL